MAVVELADREPVRVTAVLVSIEDAGHDDRRLRLRVEAGDLAPGTELEVLFWQLSDPGEERPARGRRLRAELHRDAAGGWRANRLDGDATGP
jgi:hypothetical protein